MNVARRIAPEDPEELELVFKHAGGVELRAPTESKQHDMVLWASDSDPEFSDHFGTEIMSGETDAEKVMDYLLQSNVISEEEADDLEIYDESLDGDDVEDLEDEEDDEDLDD